MCLINTHILAVDVTIPHSVLEPLYLPPLTYHTVAFNMCSSAGRWCSIKQLCLNARTWDGATWLNGATPFHSGYACGVRLRPGGAGAVKTYIIFTTKIIVI